MNLRLFHWEKNLKPLCKFVKIYLKKIFIEIHIKKIVNYVAQALIFIILNKKVLNLAQIIIRLLFPLEIENLKQYFKVKFKILKFFCSLNFMKNDRMSFKIKQFIFLL